MNEENLRSLDEINEDTNNELKKLDDLNELPPIINEHKLSEEKKTDKIINILPSWSIEPPIQIKRGEK